MPSAPMNLLFLDIGEAETVAIVELAIMPGDENVPETAWCYAQLMRLQQHETRRKLIRAGKIDFRNGHTDDDLANEVAKVSFERISARARRT